MPGGTAAWPRADNLGFVTLSRTATITCRIREAANLARTIHLLSGSEVALEQTADHKLHRVGELAPWTPK